MTTQAIITCVILVITMVLLISQKVPLVILGAAIPAALAATGVINAGSAYTEFGNTTIVFFMGLVVVGEAFFKTGLGRLYRRQDHRSAGQDRKGPAAGYRPCGRRPVRIPERYRLHCLSDAHRQLHGLQGWRQEVQAADGSGILRLSGRHHHAGGHHPPHRGKRHPVRIWACGSSASSSTPRSACPLLV